MTDRLPEWAWARMRELRDAESCSNQVQVAFVAYIAMHEDPPVDPLYEALKAVVELGRYDTREQTQLLRGELARRGLVITEKQS